MELHNFSTSLERKYLLKAISDQVSLETTTKTINRKKNGIYYTHCLDTVDLVLSSLLKDPHLIEKTIFEPSCGSGIFIQRILIHLIRQGHSIERINHFVRNNIIFNDVDSDAITQTKNKISQLYETFFKMRYPSNFKDFNCDFTKILDKNNLIAKYIEKIDYVIGNPPYVALYGRRDKKKTETLRNYYLKNYKQFPTSLKNGKINLSMIFIENGYKLLKENAEMSFILDISLFETAFQYTRKFLLENSFITEIHTNIKAFHVASGQVILKVKSNKKLNSKVLIKDHSNKKEIHINQAKWLFTGGEYKFNYHLYPQITIILQKIYKKSDPTLKALYPKKNLRTCCMLLDMETFFTSKKKINQKINLPYYEGAKGLKSKFGSLNYQKYFQYDKLLQNKINDNLKEELTKQGIKNKKRIGLGEIAVYQNPKIFIRQSAKEIIATYTESDAAANNSLYIFTLRSSSIQSKQFLKFLCGYLNSSLVSFFAQVERIIRYSKGKQPQIKIHDLYQIRIPNNEILKEKITKQVSHFYSCKKMNTKSLIEKIDNVIFSYYNLTQKEISFIREYSQAFLLS